MKKKDLADIRKEFKLDSYALNIKEVYSVYLKKDNGEIIIKELNQFERMNTEKAELYIENFKKVLTGTLDTKIFELDFKTLNTIEQLEEVADTLEIQSTQRILYKALSNKEGIAGAADAIVDKISQNFTYESDIVINFMQAEYFKGSNKVSIEAEEAIDDYVQGIELVICTVNKVDVPKKALKFDYSEMKFAPNSALDLIINLKTPLDGFMFPSFTSQYSDVNKAIYYSSKIKQINTSFVEEVLGCEVKPTAIEEKENFNAILNVVIGDSIKTDTMQEIYEKINEALDEEERNEEEEPTINMKYLQRVLTDSGVENTEELKSAFEEICQGDYEFKVKNIIPDFKSQSIKIGNENTNVTIAPRDLSSVKQIVNKSGRKCLLIELNEGVEINGFKLETEDADYI